MDGSGTAASYGDLLITSLVVLVGVCVVGLVIVRLAGRFLATGRARGAHLLGVVARLPLEPRRSLYVVEVAGKTLLVGTSEMGLNVLSELDGDVVRARDATTPTFADLVRQAWSARTARVAQRWSTGSPPGQRVDDAGSAGGSSPEPGPRGCSPDPSLRSPAPLGPVLAPLGAGSSSAPGSKPEDAARDGEG